MNSTTCPKQRSLSMVRWLCIAILLLIVLLRLQGCATAPAKAGTTPPTSSAQKEPGFFSKLWGTVKKAPIKVKVCAVTADGQKVCGSIVDGQFVIDGEIDINKEIKLK